jgi:hypothetical protein
MYVEQDERARLSKRCCFFRPTTKLPTTALRLQLLFCYTSLMNIAAIQVMSPCVLVDRYDHCGINTASPRMEVSAPSDILEAIFQNKRRHIHDDSNLHSLQNLAFNKSS